MDDLFLRDEHGAPLPFRMSPETWENMKACTSNPRPSAPNTIMGIPVVLNPNIALGIILQLNEDALTQENT